VLQYYLNGGQVAFVVRAEARTASTEQHSQSSLPRPIMRAAAANAGAWGNTVEMRLEYPKQRTRLATDAPDGFDFFLQQSSTDARSAPSRTTT
jgi:hypothetical protein